MSNLNNIAGRAAYRSAPFFAVGLALTLVRLAAAQAPLSPTAAETVTVRVDQPGAAIPSTQFGLFFEDINFAADGGLYPERVKNRSFEFPDPLMGWKEARQGGSAAGTLRVQQHLTASDSAKGHYLRVEATAPGYGVSNEGFRGIGIANGAAYVLSLQARQAVGQPSALRVELQDQQGRSVGEARISGLTPAWKTYRVTLRATGTEEKAQLSLLPERAGAVDLDEVSLFPQETWGRRKNGLRPDLVRLLKEMKPGFLRFPGGCIVEGRTLENRYQWKKTLGDPRDRRVMVNRWNMEFKHRPAPDYFQSFGLGFYEYFQLCEDIGAEPLPILNCGMACQFNSGELASLSQLDPYVQDALDLVEFANGPVTSEWGRKRAQMGHPAPFRLKMIGVGNEQWGPEYFPRYEAFARALKGRHPEISIISSAGPSPSGERFEDAWRRLRAMNADIVDEHYYEAPKWFRDNVHRYDNYPRTGPKVFAGEYAAQSVGIASPNNRNNWECALSEAAFMTGLERNAEVVRMSSYAPLFAHVDAWQWTPNLIWFDNLRSYGTPNYYVQKLFSANRGTRLLPVQRTNGQDDLFTSAALDDRTGEAVIKVVNYRPSARTLRLNLAGARQAGAATAQTLAAADLKAENSLDQPTRLAPVTRRIEAPASGALNVTLEPYSLTVYRVKVSGAGARTRRENGD